MKTHSLLSLLLLSCATPGLTDVAPVGGALVPVSAPASAPSSRPAPDSTPTSSPSTQVAAKTKVVLIEPWSVEVTLPESAGYAFDTVNQFFRTELAWRQSASLKRIAAAPPKSLAGVPKIWSSGDKLKIIEEGVSPDGSLYRVVTFEARVGMPGLPGQTIHKLETFSALYTLKPLDAKSYITCSVVMEFNAVGSSALATNLEMCLSIRKQQAEL